MKLIRLAVSTVLALAGPALLWQPAFAQPAPVAPISASPGRSGGEGGGQGSNVTLHEATKADPILKSSVGQPAGPPTGDDPASRCLRIAYSDQSSIKDAPTQIIDAAVKPARGDAPAHCVVNGYINPQIGFRLWLPLDTWNGKLMQGGCGGRCGELLAGACEFQVTRGYACIANDLGHHGTTYDNIWAIDNVASEIDFGFRATHVAVVVAKLLTTDFYGRPPRHSYFIGASTGGRQALIGVQRFPLDYDGVVSGEPAGSSTRGAVRGADGAIDGGRALTIDNKPVVTPAEIRMLHRAVVAACDANDGLADGIITDPRTCAFEPKDLQCQGAKTPDCLTAQQVAAVSAVYAGGPQKGSELAWIGAYIAEDGSAGRYVRSVSNPYRYPYSWVFNDAGNPDIRAFKAAGGKFILYQGWADEVIPPLNAVDYYETVERLMGSRAATQDFFRFFAIPGQSHIPGNIGAESLDYVVALENWVEKGQAPDRMIGHKLKRIQQMMGPMYLDRDLAPSNYLYSRPLYPYPIQARYKGRGDPDDAASFGPWDPATGTWVK